MSFGNQGNSGWQSQPPPPRGQWQGQPPRAPQGWQQGPPGSGWQQQQGPQRWQGWRQLPPPRRSNQGCLISLIVSLIIVAVGVLAIGNALLQLLSTPEHDPSPSASESEKPKMYGPDDRPAYKKLTDALDYKIENYTHLGKTGQIYDLIEADVDEGYVKAFTLTLADYRAALRFGAIGSSHNPAELDDRIHGWQSQIDALEEKFLAGEDLGVTVTIKNSDGESKTYEGKPLHQPETTEETATVDDPYTFARNYTAELDEEGTYITAGEEIAAAFGMEVVYGVADLENHCPRTKSYADVVASYCSNTPEIIWIPTDQDNGHYPQYFSEPRYVDTIKHEIAHDLIWEICKTTAPAISGKRYEGLTNSFAVLHLGADFDRLQHPDPTDPYWMDDESHEWAQQVHDGNCG